MDSIYAGAYLTIICAARDSASHGLLIEIKTQAQGAVWPYKDIRELSKMSYCQVDAEVKDGPTEPRRASTASSPLLQITGLDD